ncbi:pentapeptide repeat-containing protein [Niabella sp. CC-SYL272]|uniref:pentapeptide repeat-containing protein n=1 Tax=Niabella agricola TaxID=2891571 RepID=UPI001F1CF4E5|nr:pentapeptide repeat-containing protein [Niabella agricola]MCF3109876.1 pentapeptide repeat-containing protein [Niabella agricola]
MLNAKIIGNRITEARKKLHTSQAQLAERLFISSQAVGKWERGESMPDIVTFTRLAEILQVDLNYFSNGSVTPEALVPEPAEAPLAPAAAAVDDQPAPVAAQEKRGWDMSRGNWVDADFSGLDGLHERFSASNMRRCKFIGSDLSGLLLKSNHVEDCDFSGSDINNSRIQSSHFTNNQFTSCSLKETVFSGSYITGCNFSGADFTGTVFRSGGQEKNTIANATWKRTSFINSYIANVVFDGIIEDCYFENSVFSKVTFQNATLINTFFKCRSLKKIRFIDCRADRMTYEFLKNGKANLEGIALLPG